MADTLGSAFESALLKDEGDETQETVSQWCGATFPPHQDVNLERVSRFFSCLEELLETGHEMNVPHEEIMRVVPIMLKRCSEQGAPDPAKIGSEIGDLDICIQYLGTSLGVHILTERNKKMRFNRSRPQSYYDGKQERKRREGIRPDR